jgi:hypothetical protein
MVELELHPHASERFYEVRLVGQHEAGMARFKDHFGGGVEHPITQTAIKHPDDAPYAWLGAMFPAQSGRQRVFIEHRGPPVGQRSRGECRWRAHEGVTVRN